MGVQYGRWNFDGQTLATDHIAKVGAALAPYGPDSNELYSKSGLSIVYRAFHTTKESHRENQPYTSPSGAVITWDGRLDNRAELIGELRSVSVNSTDVAIIAASYEKWGANCLGKLIGDWALSIWNPRDRSVLLAKDPVGTKHLYYSFDDRHLAWSTILDPLVLFAGRTFEICEEYIAGWFANIFPAAHLTPYVGIHSVPPSSSVLLRPLKDDVRRTISRYWDFDPGRRIRYRTDAEYEEHFRSVLATSVQRRLRSDRPVLAELSGGMDSSSIVCVADLVIARGHADCPRLDTISWFDDSYDHLEPDSNELHWISKVEQKRHRTGFHISLGELRTREASSQSSFASEFDDDRFAAVPIPNRCPSEHFKQYGAHMVSHGYRVTISGIGGSEITGDGVPTPMPELQNLLSRARFFTLSRQLKAWAAKMNTSRLPLLWEALQGFLPLAAADIPEDTHSYPWFHPGFLRRNRAALGGYPSKVNFFGPLPNFQHNIATLEALRRLFAYCILSPELLREVRYPYLDRDLLEFMYATPREQVVRVGQRRFLMKRALVGIVPDELLNRKRKGFVPEDSRNDTPPEWASLGELVQHTASSPFTIIDPEQFWVTLQKAQRKEPVPFQKLKRTVTLEFWLRHLTAKQVVGGQDTGYSSKRAHIPRYA
jgi:asparagine synthase (glutamine-hydrolysing)